MKSIIRIILGSVLVVLTSCNKFLDIDSTRAVGEKNMWNAMEDTRAGLMGVYGLVQAAMADHNGHWLYGDLRAGEFTVPVRQDLKAIVENDLNASYGTLDALSSWRRWYAAINAANIFLERVSDVKKSDPRYTENNMAVDIAQVRFLRAFSYFYMVRIWGDLPFIISSHDGSFVNIERENQDKILIWAEQELIEATKDLPYKYSADDIQQPGYYYNEYAGRWDGALARKLSGYAILAHVAAWQGNYVNVATYSKFVLDNYVKGGNSYVNTVNLTAASGLFTGKKSNQLLGFNFEWPHLDASFTGHIEELVLASPIVNKSMPDMYIPKDSIISIFNEPKDERFSLDSLGMPGPDRYFSSFNRKYPIFSKIKSIMGGSTDPSFRIYSSAIVFTRLEDLTLLRAEALATLGEKKEAIDALNIIRTLRKLKPYKEEINGNLIDAIFKERQRELMGEGHRWYDLIRHTRIRKSNVVINRLIENGGILWPISKAILTQNQEINQNNYWK